MGDVARVLATSNGRDLQSLLHDRLVMEACENIHLHWRNIRLEMSISDTVRFVEMVMMFKRFLFMLQGKVVTVPLVAINPYDSLHRRTSDDGFQNESPEATAKHEAGIAWMVEQIQAGRTPRPIAVCPAWEGRFARSKDRQEHNVFQRCDGFKRYMAHKALKLTTIDCVFYASYVPGVQHGASAFLEPDEEELPRALAKDVFFTTKPKRLSIVESDEQRRQVNEIELLRNGTIHVHVADTRLEFTQEEFAVIAQMFQAAAAALRASSEDNGTSPRIEQHEAVG